MTERLFLSRVSLRRTAETAALSSLIDPTEPGRAMNAHHRLLWGLFGDTPDRTRDFLWRQDGSGRFYVLSRRVPVSSGLLDCETRDFAPDLAEGDRLVFRLRANATKDRPSRAAPAGEGRRVDLVMDALPAPGPARADARQDVAAHVAVEWLGRQGAAKGFDPDAGSLVLHDYATRRIPREGYKPVQLGVLDVEGVLTVRDPAQFLKHLARGFGRARAFGCGLMMIRRAP